MNVFSRSWSLTKASWGVLRDDKELIVLPVVSALSALVLIAPFVGIAALTIHTTDSGSSESTSLGIGGWVALFVAYLISAYVTIFFQSALILAANERLAGGSPTLGSALRGAWSNAGRILPWALITATVSIVLQLIQEKAGVAGRLVAGIAGVAWALVTLLVLPILVIEHVGVKEAFTRSSSAFKKTWGVNMVGNGGIGLVSMLFMLAGVVVFGPIVLVGMSSDLLAVTVLGGTLLVLWIILVSVFSAALSGVFRTALYRYAVLGESSEGFSQDQIAQAFRPKKGRRDAAVAS